jgi:hypothetical protein
MDGGFESDMQGAKTSNIQPRMGIQANYEMFLASVIFVCLLASNASGDGGAALTLKNADFTATINSASLEVKLGQRGQKEISLSSAQTNLGPVANMESGGGKASWEYPDLKLRVSVKLEDTGLAVHLLSDRVGEMTFPILPETDATKGWILPLFEGVYAPRGDDKWAAFLTKQGDLNTTADMTMPFLGMDFGDFTLTCIITNAFNNTLEFQQTVDKHLQARVTHKFTRNHPVKECGFWFQLGTNSPVEPARIYRNWLVKGGDFVTMAEKIKKTPEAAKLPGAAHIYLWGGDLIAPEDVVNWKEFIKELKAQEQSTNASIAGRVWSLMKPEARKFVEELSHAEWPDKYSEGQITADLERILRETNICQKSFSSDNTVDEQTRVKLKADSSSWTQAELCQVNSRLLVAAFPDLLSKPEEWGNGICPKMVKQLAKAGFDRLWLGSGSWDEFVERPETMAAAKEAGFLIGPYDSYNSVHRTNEANTWETSQFDQALYETGGIVNVDGSKRRGFQKKGYMLSPDAARPYVEKRVTGLMKSFAANS